MPDKLIKTNFDFENVARIVQLPPSVAAGQPVVHEQLQSAIEGLSWKESVRAASTGNINTASPGATIDGITMVSGDRALLKDQTTANQNGIYIWNGAAAVMTRSVDASTFDELESAIVFVDEGTVNAGKGFRQTGVNGTIGTTSVTWTSFASTVPAATETTPGIIEIATSAEVNAGADATKAVTPARLKDATFVARKYTATIGDGSNTQFTITHNLGTLYPVVTINRTSDGLEVIAATEALTVNTLRVSFASAPPTNHIAVGIIG